MPKTITSINSINLSAAGISGAAKTTLQAATTTLSLHAKLSLTTETDLAQGVEVYYTVSPFDLTAAAAPAVFANQAEVLDVRALKVGGSSREYGAKTDLIIGDGTYLYTWIRNGLMTGTAAFALQSVEL